MDCYKKERDWGDLTRPTRGGVNMASRSLRANEAGAWEAGYASIAGVVAMVMRVGLERVGISAGPIFQSAVTSTKGDSVDGSSSSSSNGSSSSTSFLSKSSGTLLSSRDNSTGDVVDLEQDNFLLDFEVNHRPLSKAQSRASHKRRHEQTKVKQCELTMVLQ